MRKVENCRYSLTLKDDAAVGEKGTDASLKVSGAPVRDYGDHLFLVAINRTVGDLRVNASSYRGRNAFRTERPTDLPRSPEIAHTSSENEDRDSHCRRLAPLQSRCRTGVVESDHARRSPFAFGGAVLTRHLAP